MSAKKKERAERANQPAAEPAASAPAQKAAQDEKQPMGRFFLLVFGIPFVIIVAIGLLMAFSD